MSERASLLAAVWQAVSCQVEIQAVSAAVLAAVRPFAAVRALWIRRWDAERSRLDLVAAVGPDDAWDALSARVGVAPEAASALTRWCGRWERAERAERADGLPDGAAPPGSVVLPLVEAGRLVGIAALQGRDLLAAREEVEALQAPLSVALANDRRFQELIRLREAAELDRQALLTRLGRQDVSEAIVGAEAGLRGVLERVSQVAPTDAPVLILGETGAGKEVVARAIHGGSKRAGGPFLRVNCGAIPPELVDSELFGHEKGSFTGAISQRKGWFERADGGTLFLDEVAELPPAAQVRLLRVLQDGSFQRVGGQETHSVDVRIVAATHRDMAQMVGEGSFRQDLWYRISVFPITLPALRQRVGDIAALARYFAERAGVRLFGRPLSPSPSDLALLEGYGWPGNVRELAAVIERAAILGGGRSLDVATALGAAPGVVRSVAPAMAAHTEEAQRAQIEEALRQCHGRIEGPFGAARVLHVNPHTLRSRMRRLGLDWSKYRSI